MLGMNTVKNLALGAAVVSTLGKSKNFHVLNMDLFWQHSLGVRVISKMIAKKCNVSHEQAEGFFIAGLLHDIGKVPLNRKFSDEYRLAMETSEREHQPLSISEKQFLGIDHTQVGNLIAENWKLGAEIIDTGTGISPLGNHLVQTRKEKRQPGKKTKSYSIFFEVQMFLSMIVSTLWKSIFHQK